MQTLEATTTEQARELIADAARWRLYSLLLMLPSTRRHAERAAVAREIGDPELLQLSQTAGPVSEGDYLALLGPGGRVSPRETGYRPLGDPGRILADLTGFYSAFAYSPGDEDPPDHIGVELGFVSFLRLKQAYALMREQQEAAQMAGEALNRFLEDHLGEFSAAFSNRLSRLGPSWANATAEQVGERVRWLAEVVPLNS